jgi:hypothetical protein
MLGLDWLPLSINNAKAGTVTLPFWAADLLAALLLILLLLAVYRAGIAAVIGTALRLGLVVVSVVAAWALLGRLADRDRDDGRRALDQRMQELAARATAPGSVLGCLDITASDDFERYCERAIFASPESVAAATDYLGAKLTLLADAAEYADRLDPGYAATVSAFRRTLEPDPFGLVAQVLAAREGCTADRCESLKLLGDAAHVSAHLKGASFNGLVARYAPGWPQGVKPTTLDASQPRASISPPGQRLGITFPSSASIPAVSIMTSEPGPAPAQPAAHPPATAPKRTAATPPAQHPTTRDAHPHPAGSSSAAAPAGAAPQTAPAQAQPSSR